MDTFVGSTCFVLPHFYFLSSFYCVNNEQIDSQGIASDMCPFPGLGNHFDPLFLFDPVIEDNQLEMCHHECFGTFVGDRDL